MKEPIIKILEEGEKPPSGYVALDKPYPLDMAKAMTTWFSIQYHEKARENAPRRIFVSKILKENCDIERAEKFAAGIIQKKKETLEAKPKKTEKVKAEKPEPKKEETTAIEKKSKRKKKSDPGDGKVLIVVDSTRTIYIQNWETGQVGCIELKDEVVLQREFHQVDWLIIAGFKDGKWGRSLRSWLTHWHRELSGPGLEMRGFTEKELALLH